MDWFDISYYLVMIGLFLTFVSAILICISDADLTLAYYDRYGKKIGEVLLTTN